VVEDNADTLRYLGAVLKRQGHVVTAASSLALARQAADRGEFDLVISDIELPDGTGLDLIRDLKPRGIQGIALSGYGTDEDIRTSRAAGFALHLVKPVLADDLANAIGQLANAHDVTPHAAESTRIGHQADKPVTDHAGRLSPWSVQARSR
jgi:CheY-like chemotaxis protein